MIRLTGGVGDGRDNVFAFKKRVVAKDFFEGRAGGQQIKNVCDAHALAADARLAAALAGLDGDSGEKIELHDLNCSCEAKRRLSLPLSDNRRSG